MRRPLILALAGLFCVLAWRGQAATAPQEQTAPRKIGDSDVEVKLRDGSLLRGEIIKLDMLPVKTAYGALNIPFGRIVRMQLSCRLADQEMRELDGVVKDLDSDDFNIRNQAQAKLLETGQRAVVVLRAAREKASPEMRARADAIIKKITAQNLKTDLDDSILTDIFEVHGEVDLAALNLKTWLGEAKLNICDIEAVRFLAKGRIAHCKLLPETALSDWVDTGMDVLPGEPLKVSCFGSIQLFGNANCGPAGTNNWGNSFPFLNGAVIGRLGTGGKPFLVGVQKELKTRTQARLFLKIFCDRNTMQNNGNASNGAYSVRLASGIWAAAAQPSESSEMMDETQSIQPEQTVEEQGEQ